jgi:hypothetical protein
MLLHYYLITELLSQLPLHAPKDVSELEADFQLHPQLGADATGWHLWLPPQLEEPNISSPASTRHRPTTTPETFSMATRVLSFVCQRHSLQVHKHTHMDDSLQVHKLIRTIM